MPWKDSSIVDLRREFVLRALEPGANISALCRDYRISRKTGYKWLHRFKQLGLLGLKDRPQRRPGGAFKCTVEVALDVVTLRQSYPTFGARKIRALLLKKWSAAEVPSTYTIQKVLRYMGLVKPRRRVQRRKSGPARKPEVLAEAPNDVWTVDFKGWWRSGSGKKCEPLTIRDHYSKMVLAIDIVERPSIDCVKPVFERLFGLYGLPKAIQSDNGSPFATSQSLTGLTKLSAWWVTLGIRPVRGRPGKPQDNGGHERMHKDIKDELQQHPSWTVKQQQEACDVFRRSFNWERPHQALDDRLPGDVYESSPRVYPGENLELVYPAGTVPRKVTRCGTIRYRGYLRSIGKAFEGLYVGVEPFDKNRFRVWLGELCIGVGELPWVAPLRPPGRATEQQALEGEQQEL